MRFRRYLRGRGIVPILFYLLCAVETREAFTWVGQQWARDLLVSQLLYLTVASAAKKNPLTGGLMRRKAAIVSVRVSQGFLWAYFTYSFFRFAFLQQWLVWKIWLGGCSSIVVYVTSIASDLVERPLALLLFSICMLHCMPWVFQIIFVGTIGAATASGGFLIPRLVVWGYSTSKRIYSWLSLIGPFDM